jgi:hypothetical protein
MVRGSLLLDRSSIVAVRARIWAKPTKQVNTEPSWSKSWEVDTKVREGSNNDARRDCLKEHKWEFADLCLAGAMYNISRVPRRHDETPSVQPWVQRSEQQLGGSSVKE